MENFTLRPNGTVAGDQTRASVTRLLRRLLGSMRSRAGVLIVAIVLGTIGLVTAWTWFGTTAVLPLLYVLPCAVMMLLCMRGHDGAGNTPTSPNDSSGS
jgi:Protein of unknown function (DUF2933)